MKVATRMRITARNNSNRSSRSCYRWIQHFNSILLAFVIVTALLLLSTTMADTLPETTISTTIMEENHSNETFETPQQQQVPSSLLSSTQLIPTSLLSDNNELYSSSNSSGNTTTTAPTLLPTLSPTLSPTVVNTATFPTVEYNALHDIYLEANGENWIWGDTTQIDVIPWNFTIPAPGEHNNPCVQRWEGVLCFCTSTTTSMCTTIGLVLTKHNMTGSISWAIGNLMNLEIINFNSNEFLSGVLPPTIGQLHHLQVLSLVDNVINSTIPSTYASLTNLTVFDVSDSRIHGSIPDFIGASWTQLMELGLSENFLHGTIPSSLSQLIHLHVFSMAGNFLEGTIPAQLTTAFRNLTTFTVARNQLTGPLPVFTPQYTPFLLQLSLQVNHFTGIIPEEYGNFQYLMFLEVNNNLLSGSLPNSLQDLKHLQIFTCFNNSLHGSIDMLFTNQTNLKAIEIGHNFFTGLAFPFHGEYFSNQTIVYECYNNLLTGNIPSRESIFMIISYLDIGANYLQGTIPPIIANSTALSYFYVNHNMLSGTIPMNMGLQNKKLIEFYVGNNYLEGTIPSSLFMSKVFREFSADENNLRGSIPNSIMEAWALSLFVVHGNRLTGTLPAIPHAIPVQTLDVWSNLLTGSIPSSIFTIPTLQVLGLADNCFSGSLPEEACQCMSLVSVVMDGLGTAKNCQRNLFRGIPYFTSFAEQQGSSENLPSCLFELPFISSLYLSGNNYVGTLPSAITVPPTLQDLSLAYNVLTGTIPTWIQERSWNSLDLSNNKLSGTLMSTLHEVSPSSYLSLDVNRLSGNIPDSLQSARNLSVLLGNLYTCSVEKSDLPEHDTDRNKYSCGTQAINLSIIFWVDAFVFLWFVRMLWFYWYSKTFLLDSRGMSDNSQPVTLDHDTTSSTWCFHIRRNFKFVRHIMDTAKRDWTEVNTQRGVRKSNPIRRLIFFFSAVRYVFVAILLLIVVLLMPMYGILSLWYSTYEFKYAWTVSAIFLSGISPTVLLVVGFTASTVLLFYLFQKKVYPFSERLKHDKMVHRQTMMNATESNSIVSTNVTMMPSVVYPPSSFAITEVLRSRINPRPTEANSIIVRGMTSQSITPSFMGGPPPDPSLVIPRRNDSAHLSVGNSSIVTARNEDLPRYRVSVVILGLLNFILMILVDIVYVTLILEANTQQTILIQAALSIFKVQWNEYALWTLYPRIKLYVTSLLHRIYNQPSENTQQSTDGGQATTSERLQQFQFSTHEINFMAFTVIFNNIFIPCIAIAIISPHCFYNAFFAEAPSESVTIYSCNFFRVRQQLTGQECLKSTIHVYETTYNAPFYYRYECSAAFSIKFVTVYIFMFLIVGAIIPLFHVCNHYWYYAYDPTAQPGTNTQKQQSWCGKWLFRLADYCLSRRWKPLSAAPPEDVQDFRLLTNERLLVRFSSYLAILLAFGVIFPPLAVVAVLSIYSITYFEQFAISRLLVEAKALGYTWYEEKILKECEHIAESWFDALKIMLPFVSLSFAFVVFDTLGDQYGWKAAIGPTLFIALLPVWFYLWRKLRPKDDLEDGSSEDFVYEDIIMSSIEHIKTYIPHYSKQKLRKDSLYSISSGSVKSSQSSIELRPSSMPRNVPVVQNPLYASLLQNKPSGTDAPL